MMEQDLSQLFFQCATQADALPADRSLHLDSTSLEQFCPSLGDSSAVLTPSISSEWGSGVFPNTAPLQLCTSDAMCALPSCTTSHAKLIDVDDNFSGVLDHSESFQSLGTTELVPPWDDYPMETPVDDQNIPSVLQGNVPACKTEDVFDPTLTELNAAMNLDDIESIIFGDMQTDVKSPPLPVAVVSPSGIVPSPTKSAMASPCLQQLLSGELQVKDAHILSTGSDTSSLSPVSQTFVVGEPRLVNSPKRAASPARFALSEVRSPHPAKKPKLSKAPAEKLAVRSSSTESKVGQAETSYFWQYNLQSKGPKGQRLCRSLASNDPHKLVNFEDPVFDPDLSQWNLRHTGKARRGDGNDIAPNSYRLYQIGKELQKLNSLLDGIAPEELQDGERTRAKRAKNKYASRACRLKRKAQHEANKLKLYGLEQEHSQLLKVLEGVKEAIRQYLKTGTCNESLTSVFGRLVKQHLTVMIAGYTSEYVSTVLDQVAAGDKTGGIYAH